MAVVRKVKSKVKLDTTKQSRFEVQHPQIAEVEGQKEGNFVHTPRRCLFCTKRVEPTYTDVVVLRKFVSDRGRIMHRRRTACCNKHQRELTRSIKQARYLAMVPFTVKVR